ncbi:hypothetical protein POUND7_014424 [Theobroma cacao]
MEEHLERGIALRGETKDTSIVGYNPREATVTSKRSFFSFFLFDDNENCGTANLCILIPIFSFWVGVEDQISSLFIIEFFLPYHDNLSRFMEFGLAVASIIFLVTKW